ncbi:MAG: hypothetical protein COA42_13180 [Alteromonadaceae bacterium]|nr:MAG: hypothetical protein COA42_13180 [Alteromonadaceae bacterium]
MPKHNALISRLYDSHQSELRRYVVSKFGLSHSESEDIVQTTFIKLASADQLEHVSNPRAYLFRIAHNAVIDHKRSRAYEQDLRSDSLNHSQQTGGSVEYEAFDDQQLNDPARIQCGQQQLKMMQQALNSMPQQRKEFLRLSRFEHLSNVEIARRSGISEAAVRKHISRALLDIKQMLAQHNHSGGANTRPCAATCEAD